MKPALPLPSPRSGALVLACLFAGFAMQALPARADLRVCNETTNLVSVALGYRAERGWQSEGWWQTPPGDCRVLYQGDLERRYYYLYAVDDVGGGDWGGSIFMCTRDESFTIFGVEDCLARGYERTGFFEVDTEGRADWTLQLTDAANGVTGLEGNGDDPMEDPLFLVDEPPSEGDEDADPPQTEGTDPQ